MRLCVVLIIVQLIAGCGTSEGVDTPESEGVVVTERVDLPPPVVTDGGSLADALARRRSVREFQPVPLD